MPLLAQDAVTSNAVRALQEFRVAQQECAPVLGHAMALDSAYGGAADVYKAALTAMGCDTAGINSSALGDVFRAIRTARRDAGRPLVAETSAGRASFGERYPGAMRIKQAL